MSMPRINLGENLNAIYSATVPSLHPISSTDLFIK